MVKKRRWRDMSEAEREAVRQASAAQSAQLAERAREFDRAMDIWRAKDVYEVQNFFLGLAVLCVVVIVLALCASFTR